jgi:hypothetical protein
LIVFFLHPLIIANLCYNQNTFYFFLWHQKNVKKE